MRIAICDDDIVAGKALAELLSQWYGSAHIIRRFFSGNELLDAYRSQAPDFDVLLLDIIMPGLSGIETAQAIRDIDSTAVIIFITTSEEYSLLGYSVKAQDYVLKPFIPDALRIALDQALQAAERRDKIILVRHKMQTSSLHARDILYIERRERKCYFVLSDAVEIESSDSLARIYETLPKGVFFMSDQSFIINLRHVVMIDQKEKRAILRNTDALIPISRPKLKPLLDALTRYTRG